MITVNLMGGMGNQMFQYAVGKALSLKYQVPLQLDITELLDRTPRPNFVFRDYDLDIFCLQANLIAFSKKGITNNKYIKWMLKTINSSLPIRFRKYFAEPHFHYTEHINLVSSKVYLHGYWQSPKYFESIEADIRNDFRFKEPLAKDNLILQVIQNTKSICLNVRRADFVTNSFHGTMDNSYYKNAVEKLESLIGTKMHIFVFSDDIKWCEKNLLFDYPTTYVGHEHKGKKFANYLELMIACKHFIIPNSSFAWWAAWLCEYENKVIIAPTKWFSEENLNTEDLIPQTWLRI